MRITGWVVLLAVGFVLYGAPPVWAWGPATHIGLAGSVLDQLALLPIGVAAVLARHRFAYLFGSMATDVVFAKRLSRVKQFCHHWSTGFRLLDKAADERAQAFAYGYLSHLAADTVAHGKFVPRQIVVSGSSVSVGHLYWELRADALQSDSTWSKLEGVLRYDHAHHHEALSDLITDTFLSYPLNRLLFNGMNALAVRREFRRTVDVWNRRSRWYLSPELVISYRAECLDRIHSILTEGTGSPLLREDPNGTSALMQLRVRRREVRRLKRRGMPVERRLREVSRGFAPTTKNGRGIIGASPKLIGESDPEPTASLRV
jgi:hypothetical protein